MTVVKVRIWRSWAGDARVRSADLGPDDGVGLDEVVVEVPQEVWDRYLAADVRYHFARKALLDAAGWREEPDA